MICVPPECGSLRTSEDMSSQFRNLLAWQGGVALAVDVYRVCEKFPRAERFGLVQQMQRAGVSIPSNLAEGRGRGTIPDYRRFVLQARGSTYELETQIEIARRLGFMTEEEAIKLTNDANDVERMIHGLIRSLDRRAE